MAEHLRLNNTSIESFWPRQYTNVQ